MCRDEGKGRRKLEGKAVRGQRRRGERKEGMREKEGRSRGETT